LRLRSFALRKAAERVKKSIDLGQTSSGRLMIGDQRIRPSSCRWGVASSRSTKSDSNNVSIEPRGGRTSKRKETALPGGKPIKAQVRMMTATTPGLNINSVFPKQRRELNLQRKKRGEKGNEGGEGRKMGGIGAEARMALLRETLALSGSRLSFASQEKEILRELPRTEKDENDRKDRPYAISRALNGQRWKGPEMDRLASGPGGKAKRKLERKSTCSRERRKQGHFHPSIKDMAW